MDLRPVKASGLEEWYRPHHLNLTFYTSPPLNVFRKGMNFAHFANADGVERFGPFLIIVEVGYN